MDRDARSYLWDIQDAANAIGRFTTGMNAQTFAEFQRFLYQEAASAQ